MTVNIHPRGSASHKTIRPDFATTGAAGNVAPASQMNDAQELALMNLIKAGDYDARQNLIARNLRIVLGSTTRYSAKGVRIFELLEAGNLGLTYALENFEPDDAESFLAYASRCIRRNIEHAIMNRDARGPARLGRSAAHEQYRIVPGDDAEPASVRLIRDTFPNGNDQTD